MRQHSVVCVLLAIVMLATHAVADEVVRFTRQPGALPHGWSQSAAARASEPVRVTLALQHELGTAARLEKELFERADPASPMYGRWLSREEIDALAAPAKPAVHAVQAWVSSLTAQAPSLRAEFHNDVVVIHATVKDMEAVVFPQARWFRFSRGKEVLVAALGRCTLPSTVHEAVRLVSGLSDFPPLQRRRTMASTRAAAAASPIP